MSSIEVENLVKVETLPVDDYGRVTLGKEYAGKELKIIVDDPQGET